MYRKETLAGTGQLVLVATTVVAIGLLVVALGYVQLGYDGPAETADRTVADPEADVLDTLQRMVDATESSSGTDAATTAATAREQLELSDLERIHAEHGIVYSIEYNDSAAQSVVSQNPQRYQSIEGVIVCADRAELVGIAVDIHILTDDRSLTRTAVIKQRPHKRH